MEEEKKLAACLKCVKVNKHTMTRGWWHGCSADEVAIKKYNILTGETTKRDADCYDINKNGECPYFTEKVN